MKIRQFWRKKNKILVHSISAQPRFEQGTHCMVAKNAIHCTTRALYEYVKIIQNRWLQKALYTIWWQTLCTVQEFVIFSFQFPFFYKISPWKNSIILLLCKNVHLKWSHEEFSHVHWLLKFISFWSRGGSLSTGKHEIGNCLIMNEMNDIQPILE